MGRRGCLQALRTLEAEGRRTLPVSPQPDRHPVSRPLDAPVAPAVEVPASVEPIIDLPIQRVDTGADRAIWNPLIGPEPPRGMTRFEGAPVR